LPAAGTAFAYDERCLLHDNGSMVVDSRASGWIDVPHAENALRVSRAMRVLEQAGVVSRLERLPARVPTVEELLTVHTGRHLDALRDLEPGAGAFDPGSETAIVGPEARAGAGSVEAAMLAAGAALEAVDFVLEGDGHRAYSLTRPPGHHASADQAMGFCLLNSAALAARHAREAHGLGRVAIVDWDVHHGNGTQAVFYDDPDVLFISIHQDALYPEDLGTVEEKGAGDGEGANVNLPLPAGTGDAGYLAAVDEVVVPALERFDPALIVLSSGQDAGACDPLGRMSVTTEGFRDMTRRLVAFADWPGSSAHGRIAAIQEGGYSVDHMPFCVLATIEALAGFAPALEGDPVEMDVPTGIRQREVEAIRTAAAAAGLA
jgi:acetoin utilization deacetylase AcuC-like enzyme